MDVQLKGGPADGRCLSVPSDLKHIKVAVIPPLQPTPHDQPVGLWMETIEAVYKRSEQEGVFEYESETRVAPHVR